MVENNALDILQIIAALLTSVGAATAGAVAWLVVNRDRVNRSRYDKVEDQASLGMLRALYEERLADLTARLTATQERWTEVNHLLLDAQRGQADQEVSTGRSGATTNRFLESLGIESENIKVDPKYVFVLTPFSKSEGAVYDSIRESCATLGLRAGRGDEEFVEGPILPHIVREILRARMVIGNISSRNPNVFYELGIAQALGKATILVSRRTKSEVPFDVRSRRIMFFETGADLRSGLVHELARWVVDMPINIDYR